MILNLLWNIQENILKDVCDQCLSLSWKSMGSNVVWSSCFGLSLFMFKRHWDIVQNIFVFHRRKSGL